MDELNKNLFLLINQKFSSPYIDTVLPYLYGYKFPEVAFLVLCVLAVIISLMYPRMGPKASMAAALISFACLLGSPLLAKYFNTAFPFSEIEGAILRVRGFAAHNRSSAMPVSSVFVFSSFTSVLCYYFAAKTPALLLVVMVYALGPIYLGVGYPTDSYFSMFLGFGLGYLGVLSLTQVSFFDRHTQ